MGDRVKGFLLALIQAVIARGGHGHHFVRVLLWGNEVSGFGYALGLRIYVRRSCILRGFLRVRIQRGADGVAATGDIFLGDPLFIEVLQHIIAEESGVISTDAAVRFALRSLRHAEVLQFGGIGFGLGERARGDAGLEHGITTFFRALRVGVGIQRGRGLHHSGQEC